MILVNALFNEAVREKCHNSGDHFLSSVCFKRAFSFASKLIISHEIQFDGGEAARDDAIVLLPAPGKPIKQIISKRGVGVGSFEITANNDVMIDTGGNNGRDAKIGNSLC